MLPPPVRSAAEAGEALAWAEAISKAGERLCEAGWEDEALACYAIGGSLLERAGEFDGDAD